MARVHVLQAHVHPKMARPIFVLASSRTFVVEAFFICNAMFRTSAPAPRLVPQLKSSIRPWIQVRHRGRPAGQTRHWTDEKLAVSERYPLTAELNEHMHPSLVEKKTKLTGKARGQVNPLSKTFSNVHLRTQIVSPDLCGMSYL
jgi:hypothetical protein